MTLPEYPQNQVVFYEVDSEDGAMISIILISTVSHMP